jgi:hypothetical protein
MTVDSERAGFVVRRTLLASHVRLLTLFEPTGSEGVHWPLDEKGRVLGDAATVRDASQALLDRASEVVDGEEARRCSPR